MLGNQTVSNVQLVVQSVVLLGRILFHTNIDFKLLNFPEQIGVEIIDDLDTQRESLIRTRDRVS